jgi:hypothetical protein
MIPVLEYEGLVRQAERERDEARMRCTEAIAERESARAIARRQLKALKRVRDGWGEPWQRIVCDAIDATEALPWAKDEGKP